MVIASASEMNVMLTSAHVSRFTAMPRLAPCARSRSGMTSALYVPASGPSPTENAAMKARTDATVAAAAAAPGTLMMSAAPSGAIDAATPAVLARPSRPPAETVGEERGHQDEARLDDPDTDDGAEHGLVRRHTGLPEYQRAVQYDGVDAGRLLDEVHPDDADEDPADARRRPDE